MVQLFIFIMAEGEQSAPKLENHRFTPTPDSLAKMKVLRANLAEVQNKIPEVRGLAYFGSRTVGNEHTDPEKPSDQDIVVFYDGSEFNPQQNQFNFEKGRLVMNKMSKPEREHNNLQREGLIKRIESDYIDQFRALSLPVEYNHETGLNATIQIFDISSNATDKDFGEFIREVDTVTSFGKKPLEVERVTPTTLRLLSRFYLGTGEGLYQNRQYILDKLAEMPDGERYFSALMSHLNYHERTKPTEKREGLPPARLPSSISEGRDYFLTRPPTPTQN